MKTLDLGPDPHWSKMLDPDPYLQWIHCGSETLLFREFESIQSPVSARFLMLEEVLLSPASSFKPCCPSFFMKYQKPGSPSPCLWFSQQKNTKTNQEILVTVICYVFCNLFRRTGTRVPHPGAGPGWKFSVRSSPSFLSSSQVPVLRTRDVYPGSEFFHPGSQIQGEKYSWIRIRIKEFNYFNPKNCF